RIVRGRAPEDSRRLLFVFTGMAAQYHGMGRDLYREHPLFRSAVEECDALFAPLAGWSLERFFRDGERAGEHGSPIPNPRLAQPTNLVMQVGLTRLWESFGVVPDGVVGHSAGEIAAAWAAGILTLDDAV